jgi:intracellular sulfur oxidation DsrE/DsrF family protein
MSVPVTPRRGFLGKAAAVAAVAGLGSIVPAELAAVAAPSRARDPKLDAWFGKITGKHRQVFDAPEPNSGMAAVWPRVYINTMNATFGEGDGVTAVVILRHGALGLAMNDSVWAKYSFGKVFNVNDGAGKPATANPYAKITNLPLPGLGVTELLDDGVLIGACDVAMTVYSSMVATQMKLDPAEVRKEWVAALYPGIQLVPSGVMAVGRAQELGCAYCFAG